MDADRALPGGPAQTDGYARGTFPSQLFVQNTENKRQENNHVRPKASCSNQPADCWRPLQPAELCLTGKLV